MAKRRIKRNAATPKGFKRRIADLELGQVNDPRHQPWVEIPLLGALTLSIYALLSGARSQRAVEDRSEQLTWQLEQELGIDGRISDNAFGEILQRIDWRDMRWCLHRGVLAEWARKGLRPTVLPWSTVAIDGKHEATIPEWHLRRLLDDDPDNPAGIETLRALASARFPYIQLQDGAGGIVGLVRVHNAALISADAPVVIDQEPILGRTNEMGTIPKTVRGLFSFYGQTQMLGVFTVDAGNTNLPTASFIFGRGSHYLMTIAEPHGEIHREALRTLAKRADSQAQAHRCEEVNGNTVAHTLWVEPLPDGYLRWTHARALLRVERTVVDGNDEVTIGTRYYVCSMPSEMATPDQLLAASRAHWRVENEVHWTADARWDEDARRTPWTMHPTGILVVGLMRAIAINIAAILRALSRIRQNPVEPDEPDPPDPIWLKPTWKTIAETALMLFFQPLLDTTEFDTAALA
jgi:predicted transposase YbfD/YdcC